MDLLYIIRVKRLGRALKRKACPLCGSENSLKMIFFGEPLPEIERLVDLNPKIYTLGGCDCLDGDRDPVYICSKCSGELSKDFKQIRLITCPLEASNLILEEECRNYRLLESKPDYELLTDREFVCNKICPLMGKHVRLQTKDGTYYRGIIDATCRHTNKQTADYLKLRIDLNEYQHEYTDINIPAISNIESYY